VSQYGKPEVSGEGLLGLTTVSVERCGREVELDWAVLEEPLQIRVEGEALAVTMRTPGADLELAAGFVFTEGLIDRPEDLSRVEMASDVFESPHPDNTVNVFLSELAVSALPARRAHAERDFRASSACGVCGKKTISSLRQLLPPIEPLVVRRELLENLPDRMREKQPLFQLSGGIHAAALFNPAGEMEALYEDIGRHNAVDKLIGAALLDQDLRQEPGGRSRFPWPLKDRILVLSGRVGFEVVQKALRASVPVIVAVGAASSLAVEMVEEAGATLYSFAAPGRGNRHVASPKA
jgi:FdhD protein